MDLLTLERERVRKKLASELFGAEARPVRIGRFEILRHLGRGSFCIVYAAFDPELRREVAVKLLTRSLDRDQVLREARALAGLKHPNVLTVFETGVHEGVAFIVTEFVHGGSLREWAQALSKSDRSTRLLRVLIQVARGLEAAHRCGLVHRDVKPENVLMGPNDRPLIADFGLAAPSSDPGVSPAGTLRYMPPEQARLGLPDPRSDQYSFCVMALELLEGQAPRGIERALARGRAAEADARFGSMTDLLRALEGASTKLSAARTVTLAALIGGGAALLFTATAGGHERVRASVVNVDLESARPPSAEPSNRSHDIERAARAASELMLQGNHRGCVDQIRDDFGSPILSGLRIECARRLQTKDLQQACEAHERAHHEIADGCGVADLRARSQRDAAAYEGCILSIEPLPWTPQRSLLMSDCANRWDTSEGRLRLCEWLRRHDPPPLGTPPCGGSETLDVVLKRKAQR